MHTFKHKDDITTENKVKEKEISNNVGEGLQLPNAQWSFSGPVAESFDTHINKSIPFYPVNHQLIKNLSDFFIRPQSTCYDLGCSTGKLLNLLSKSHPSTVNWVGLDREQNMIEKARQNALKDEVYAQYLCEDISTYDYEKSDLIISCYTMQFISPAIRQNVLKKIYDALNWGGAFIMFEKVRAPDARFQDICSTLYTDYKLEQGHTSSEIIAKTRSLKGRLSPFSTADHLPGLSLPNSFPLMTFELTT